MEALLEAAASLPAVGGCLLLQRSKVLLTLLLLALLLLPHQGMVQLWWGQ